MPRARFEKLPRDKRVRILSGAAREFVEHGYDGSTIAMILEHAEISTGAAYYYFDNKADLFAATVHFYVEEVMEHADVEVSFASPDAFWESLVRVADGLVETTYETHRILGGLKAAWKKSREARAIEGVEQAFAAQERLLRMLVTKGREIGAVRTDLPEELVFHLLAGIDEGMDNYVQAHHELDPIVFRSWVRPLIGALRAALAPPAQE
jgi:AcrR family transcriptional regulator